MNVKLGKRVVLLLDLDGMGLDQRNIRWRMSSPGFFHIRQGLRIIVHTQDEPVRKAIHEIPAW